MGMRHGKGVQGQLQWIQDRYEAGKRGMRQAKGLCIRYKGYEAGTRGMRQVQGVQDRYEAGTTGALCQRASMYNFYTLKVFCLCVFYHCFYYFRKRKRRR